MLGITKVNSMYRLHAQVIQDLQAATRAERQRQLFAATHVNALKALGPYSS